MEETSENGGHFTEIVVRPVVVILQNEMVEKANLLHHQALQNSFLTNSCNFPIRHQPKCIVK